MTHASCRQSAAAGCSPSFAPTAASTSSNQIHRFTHRWEAEASLQLRVGDPRALDAYQAHGRIRAGTIDEHLAWIGERWIASHQPGHTTALVASTNEHVDRLNAVVQTARVTAGHLDAGTAVAIGGGEHACIGDLVATRRNDRRLVTTTGEPVRNRELWTVTDTDGRRVAHRVPHRRTRPRGPSWRVRAGARPAWLRRHRTGLPVRHRRRRHRTRRCRHHSPRPVRGGHPRTRRELDLRHHGQLGPDRGPRRPRNHPRRGPGRHPRRHPTPTARRTRPRHSATFETVGTAGTV